MRKLFKKLTLICATVAVVSVMMPTMAFAALTCEDLNNPDKTKDWIITPLEEEIGSATPAQQDSAVIMCYRVTDCTTTDKKKECKSPDKKEYQTNCTPSDTRTCQRVQVLMAKSGASLLYSYIGLIYRWAAGVIGIVSVLYMVYGGIRIASAGDNAGAIDEAKTKIMQSIAGLILLFLSAVILYTINPNFFTA